MKPYYADDAVTLYHGDCRDVLATIDPVDVVIADPPYGDTSLGWDVPVGGWVCLLDAPQLWCFGSMRAWLREGAAFAEAGWVYGQEVVWEKHNGSSFHADRFKRVHEFAIHWYRGRWAELHVEPPVTFDAVARRVVRRNKRRPPHMGDIGGSTYASEDGGPRLMRSVLQVRSEHGRAVHPTQKPIGILTPLIAYSCPVGGTVLDPFAGSGSSLVAAKLIGRRAIGIEVDERYCEIAATRCAQDVLPLEAA